jgi:hypothetical protein
MKDGDKIAILRPDDPALAIKMAYATQEIEDDAERERAFKNILRAQPYAFVGLVSTVGKPDRKLLNEHGWAIGTCKPGDSMVPYRQILEASAKAQEEMSKTVVQPESVRLGGGDMTLKLEVGEDGALGPVMPDKSDVVVEPVGGGPAETLSVGTWKAKCVCGGHVSATYEGEKPNGLIHSDPPCRDFVEKDPLEFVTWLNQKTREAQS